MATSGPKYQVFISSTYEDLKDERNEAIRAVLEMGHIPVGMEMFSAADDEQWKIIARHIEESDYYVALVAHRYGSVTEDGVSFTRKEYEYARSIGVPCLGFILADDAPWRPEDIESDNHARESLASFKTLVKEKPVQFWRSSEELHGKISIALMKAFNTNPREGWVRASTSVNPEASAELLRLSSENASLRKIVDKLRDDSTSDRTAEARETFQILRKSERALSYRYQSYGEWQETEASLLEIFRWLAPQLLIEDTTESLSNSLAMNIRADEKKSWDIVAINHMQSILADFVILDLVQPSPKKHQLSDNSEYWSLTSNGVQMLKAIRRFSLLDEHKEERESPEDSPTDARQSPDLGTTETNENPPI